MVELPLRNWRYAHRVSTVATLLSRVFAVLLPIAVCVAGGTSSAWSKEVGKFGSLTRNDCAFENAIVHEIKVHRPNISDLEPQLFGESDRQAIFKSVPRKVAAELQRAVDPPFDPSAPVAAPAPSLNCVSDEGVVAVSALFDEPVSVFFKQPAMASGYGLVEVDADVHRGCRWGQAGYVLDFLFRRHGGKWRIEKTSIRFEYLPPPADGCGEFPAPERPGSER